MVLADRSAVLGLAAVACGLFGLASVWRAQASDRTTRSDPTCRIEPGGLSDVEIWSTMRRSVPRALPCISPSGASSGETLHLRMSVACTGAVEQVEVANAGAWPEGVVDCVSEKMAATRFPPHGLAGGTIVDVPIKASFQGTSARGLARGRERERP